MAFDSLCLKDSGLWYESFMMTLTVKTNWYKFELSFFGTVLNEADLDSGISTKHLKLAL